MKTARIPGTLAAALTIGFFILMPSISEAWYGYDPYDAASYSSYWYEESYSYDYYSSGQHYQYDPYYYQPYAQPMYYYEPTYYYQGAYYPQPSYSYGGGVNPHSYSIPTGDTDALGNELCYWEDYGRSSCDFNPHQWVYDAWTGTWY